MLCQTYLCLGLLLLANAAGGMFFSKSSWSQQKSASVSPAGSSASMASFLQNLKSLTVMACPRLSMMGEYLCENSGEYGCCPLFQDEHPGLCPMVPYNRRLIKTCFNRFSCKMISYARLHVCRGSMVDCYLVHKLMELCREYSQLQTPMIPSRPWGQRPLPPQPPTPAGSPRPPMIVTTGLPPRPSWGQRPLPPYSVTPVVDPMTPAQATTRPLTTTAALPPTTTTRATEVTTTASTTPQTTAAPTTTTPTTTTTQPTTPTTTTAPPMETTSPTTAPTTSTQPTTPSTTQPTTPSTAQPTTPSTTQPTTPSTTQPTTPSTAPPTTPSTAQPTTPSTTQPTTPSTAQPTTPSTSQPTTPSTTPSTTQPTTQPATQPPTTQPTTQPSTTPTTRGPSCGICINGGCTPPFEKAAGYCPHMSSCCQYGTG